MRTDGATRTRSPKGEREAARILTAATRSLARDGFGGATLGRIAAEAGVDKKMVVYYFSGRDPLLVELIRDIGRRVTANIADAIAQLSDLEETAETAIEKMWEGAIEEPELPRAYLALLAGSRESEPVAQALAELRTDIERLFEERITAVEANGYRLVVERAGFRTLMLAIWRGLALEWAENGDTPALDEALAQFKRVVMSSFEAAPE